MSTLSSWHFKTFTILIMVVTVIGRFHVVHAATTELVVNGDFELGSTGWVDENQSIDVGPWPDWHSGSQGIYNNTESTGWNPNYGLDTITRVGQVVTIPANATRATFSYWYRWYGVHTRAEYGSDSNCGAYMEVDVKV